MAMSDVILEGVLQSLGLGNASPGACYSNLYSIVSALQGVHASQRIDVKVTGTISERLCEFGLKMAGVPYQRMPPRAQYAGDFVVQSIPQNVIISAKSFKAKERLIASGSGSPLVPTVGWGLFDDPSEWSQMRLMGYLARGFCAIYMPSATMSALHPNSVMAVNPFGRPIVRDLLDFPADLSRALSRGWFDLRQF